jgi:AraC-like DNA-binding protein
LVGQKKEERLAQEVYLQRYIHPDLRIESTSDCKDSPKKLNFLTVTAFEGCDIYQSDGVSYVCAAGKKRSTRLEIHCQIPQIINRIRDSKYRDRAYLLYVELFTKNCNTKDSLLKKTEEEIKEAEKLLKDIRKISPRIKEIINKKCLDTHGFLILENNKYIINKNARKRALSQCNALSHFYYVTGENP